MGIVQKLSKRDFTLRRNTCEALLEKNIAKDLIIYFSDEAHFHLLCINKQNVRYWADPNPRELHQRPLHSPKVTVWCASFQ